MTFRDRLLAILDLARWAPSGDNKQSWRFEIVGNNHIAIHGYDTRGEVLYDFDGHASHMAHGALLETLRIAATQFGMTTEWARRPGTPDTSPIYDVRLTPAGVAVDPLVSCIKTRTVQRRLMRTTPLTDVQRAALHAATGSEYEVQFFESFSERQKMAVLLWRNAHIRLTCPEAYAVHKDIIEWGARYSKDRIPEEAVGVDPMTAKVMRWVMQDWQRVDFFNRYLLGTVAIRIQLDVLPAIFCAAHVLVKTKRRPSTLEDYVRAGIAFQRLWLTATSLGLHLQPEMTPVIFHWYVNARRTFSALPRLMVEASAVAASLDRMVGKDGEILILCRVGCCRPPLSRSVRLELHDLMLRSAA